MPTIVTIAKARVASTMRFNALVYRAERVMMGKPGEALQCGVGKVGGKECGVGAPCQETDTTSLFFFSPCQALVLWSIPPGIIWARHRRSSSGTRQCHTVLFYSAL